MDLKVLNLAKIVALSNQSEAVKNNRTPEEHVNHTLTLVFALKYVCAKFSRK